MWAAVDKKNPMEIESILDDIERLVNPDDLPEKEREQLRKARELLNLMRSQKRM